MFALVSFSCLFTKGNKETLMSIPLARGQDVRKELLEFHSKYFSANVMGLAVMGKGEMQCACTTQV